MTFKVILQSEAAECALACLAMVATHHGSRETLSSLRRRMPVSSKGTTLRQMILTAGELGFETRPVKCELDELVRLDLPAVLHWDLDHFVVLTRINGRSAEIADPARGMRKITLEDLSRHFTGVALELSPSPEFRKKKVVERVRLSDLWTRIVGLRRFLVQVFVLSLALQAIALLLPLANQIVVDDVIARGDRELLFAVLFGFGALAAIQLAVELVRSFVQLHAAQRLSLQLSGNILRHLLNLPSSYFEKRHVGDVVSRFGSLGPAQGFLTSGVIGIGLDALMVIPVAIVMLIYSPLLSAIALTNVLVIFIARSLTFPTYRRLAEEGLVLGANAQSVFLESIRASRAIKLAAREAERHGVWQNAVTDQQNAIYRQTRFTIWGGAGFASWQTVHSLIMLYFGALQVIEGNMTLGMYFAFATYSAQFSGRIGGLISAFFTYRMLGLHLERLGDIVHADPEASLDPQGAGPRDIEGRLELRDVSYRYSDHDPWIFREVNLVIEPGQSAAIVGPSGGGKSTLLSVMTGLYPPNDGDVLLDGHPITRTGLRRFRQHVGIVMQDDQLMSGTITDNVAFFDVAVDFDLVREVCIAACIHDDISKMPMGYNSLIGDMGSSLSGGQKQRLLLARALYKKPRLLFLDEGTANLDPDLERQVLANIRKLNITRISVAHRPAAVQGVDMIIQVADGVVARITPPASPSNLPEGRS